MADEKSPKLEELTKLATDFVTTHKGFWDHEAWTSFLEDLKKKGFDVSDEMQSKLGELLEAMKGFYSAAASTESMEQAMKTVVDDSLSFVKRQHGIWGHSEWEDFIKTVQGNTQALSEGTASYLGGILESIKGFYGLVWVPGATGQVSEETSEPTAAAKAALPEAEQVPEMVPQEAQAGEAEPAAVESAQPEPSQSLDTEPESAKEGNPGNATANPAPSPEVREKKDDLTAIGGIGPALEKKLYEAGIFSYAQIASLSDEQIEHLEKNIIKYSGRIARDDWIGQAKRLV